MSQRDARFIGGVYHPGQQITAGGMLTSYTAYNRNTSDVVGLHIIECQSPQQLQVASSFFQQLEKRRAIQSPHVIHVHDWGIDQNRIYIATDPPRGVTLQHVVDNENIELVRALELTHQLVEGLKTLHEHQVVGLDLRPQLITVDTIGLTDRIQIDDLGLRLLLRQLGYISSQKADDIGFLDPRYAPPEYIMGGQIGPWTDIYQVGLLFFLFITGRLPFVGSTPAETGILQNTAPIPHIHHYNHNSPPRLQHLIEHMLNKEPQRRFAQTVALLNALTDFMLPAVPNEKKPDNSTTSVNLTTEISLYPDLSTPLAPLEDLDQLREVSEPLPQGIPEDGVYAYLCHNSGNGQKQRFPLNEKSIIVGRLDPKRGLSPDLDLTAVDPKMTISRQHARIRFEGAFFYIEDLKSRNKTRLGEVVLTPLKAELLKHGATVTFGSVRMTFEIAGIIDSSTTP